jgi:probable HAF family extracellular repeat protein
VLDLRKAFLGVLGVVCAANGCSSRSSAPAATWTAADLGPGRCVALNNLGQVLGIDDSGNSFVVSAGAAPTTLAGLPDGSLTIGLALADSGDVVGYSEGAAGRNAIRYSAGAWAPVDGVVGPWSVATAFGPTGEIVGWAGTDAMGGTMAFRAAAGALTSLALPAGQSSAAYVAGAAGSVVGIFETTASVTHGFLIAKGQLTDLGTLGGGNSTPYAMNGRGDIAGASETAAGATHAFLSPGGGALVDLGLPAGAISSDARGVDDQGRVAGNADDGAGGERPVVFVVGKDAVELMPADSAGKPFVSAHVAAMSPDGHIVGWGLPQNGGGNPIHCLLWSPGK